LICQGDHGVFIIVKEDEDEALVTLPDEEYIQVIYNVKRDPSTCSLSM